ncbi:MAG: hypothetical protein SVO26_05645 [Chloroflexota bacterium]|nr:hypothetical protein [Chloroflexota bacterium]
MSKQTTYNQYISRKSKLMKDFDRVGKIIEDVLVSAYGDHIGRTIWKDACQEFEMLIPEMPDIGGSKNMLEGSFIGSV